ncbi:MAG: nitroreductase family deazaflavin-dependent oxidoreductase [Chloroflexi bacterium]|nr:nitroreductase family deazaflavin-dependent oxidoreductase [Chloroflexota bacterium]
MVYKKPNTLTKKLSSFFGWLAARGFGPRRMVRLEHKGRVSGGMRSTAVVWTEHDGQRYLVAPRGETQWVRNVRADGGRAVLRRGGNAESVRLEEIPAEGRAAIIKQYVGEYKIVKGEFGLEPDDSIEQYQGIAANHPTFQIHAQ